MGKNKSNKKLKSEYTHFKSCMAKMEAEQNRRLNKSSKSNKK